MVKSKTVSSVEEKVEDYSTFAFQKLSYLYRNIFIRSLIKILRIYI